MQPVFVEEYKPDTGKHHTCRMILAINAYQFFERKMKETMVSDSSCTKTTC